MDDSEPIAVASAVVVPRQDEADRPPTRSSPESTKRSRNTSPPAGGDSISEKRRRITGAEEEKRRGKRLFGALLGTIGKFQKETSSARARTTAVKRKEVEQKLQEKLKAQTEELDERRKREDEDFNLRKRVEAREFEERAMRIRHNNLLAQANMLTTTTSPKLFYLPWKLLPSQEDTIREQIDAAAETVRNGEYTSRRVRERDEAQLHTMGWGEGDIDHQPDIPIHTLPHDEIADAMNHGQEIRVRPDEHGDNADRNPVPRDEDEDTSVRRNSDIGDGADIVDEGGEDTVIY
ncbi:pinin/SDK/memA/ protein conserved region-domain-containing protein [Sphaerosporella brunnea]|uniref:Pinin/SDK/memA/ protein conserved region-domain-containing protein n=1 Tax=Sphaerosporella brunnea TaxID=1250544 RepID=A0A5J5EZJ8_9PEZI|nr:pinin/SDK/memA/ protein conserved region-domain-containing protein [Sphaerosporella brunnea]